MAVGKATNLGIDKHRMRDGGGSDGGAKDGSRELSARTHNRPNKERAHYVGTATSCGWTTPLGYGCFAEDYGLPLISNRLCNRASPLTRSVLRSFRRCCSRPTASVLLRASCVVATCGLGNSAAVSSPRIGCPYRYRHISKDDVLAELQPGSASAVPKKPTWREQLTRQHRLPRRRRRRRRDSAARLRR